VQPTVELVSGEKTAFVEQFLHGDQIGGGDPLVGANSCLAVVGSSGFGRRIGTIHAHMLAGQR